MCERKGENGKEVKSLSQEKEERQSPFCSELCNAQALYPSLRQSAVPHGVGMELCLSQALI